MSLLIVGFDPDPEDLAVQNQHQILMTTALAKAIAERMEDAAGLIEDHRDAMLADQDQVFLDELIWHLRDDATGLSLIALNEEGAAPIVHHRVWRAPAPSP